VLYGRANSSKNPIKRWSGSSFPMDSGFVIRKTVVFAFILGGKFEPAPRGIGYAPMKLNNRFHWASIPRGRRRNWAKGGVFQSVLGPV